MGIDPGAAEDVQDMLFLHDSRPLLIRLHILVDGKPYPARWNDYLTRWFHFLDRDDDGFLDRKEAACAPAIRVLEDLFSNPYIYALRDAPAFEDFDGDRDKRVSLAEFLRYYRPSSAGPIQLVSEFQQPMPPLSHHALTEALYHLLDKDGDGKLSRTELEKADNVLRKLDQDDDELLTLQELQVAIPVPRMAVVSAGRAVVPAIPLRLVPREDAARRLDARLPMADAEVVVRLGRVEDRQETIASVGAKNSALAKKASNALSYSAPDHCVNLIASASGVAPPGAAARQQIVQQFQALDAKGRGVVSKKQLQTPENYYLHAILAAADRDGDDCLDLKELNDFLDLTASGVSCQITVALAASGRGLFALLDADQDNRLSLRERRNAWKRLAVYDGDKDGAIDRQEIPLQYQIVLTQVLPNYQAGQLSAFPIASEMAGLLMRGPVWFRKMDRNGDGDLSPREFLGSRAAFRRLDSDGDGLISLEEALRADAAMRKK